MSRLFQNIAEHGFRRTVALAMLSRPRLFPEKLLFLLNGKSIHRPQRKRDTLNQRDVPEINIDRTAHIEANGLENLLNFLLQLRVHPDLESRCHERSVEECNNIVNLLHDKQFTVDTFAYAITAGYTHTVGL